MWREFRTERALGYAFQIPWIRQSIRLHRLWRDIRSQIPAYQSRKASWSCAAFVHNLWQGVFAEANISNTHEVSNEEFSNE